MTKWNLWRDREVSTIVVTTSVKGNRRLDEYENIFIFIFDLIVINGIPLFQKVILFILLVLLLLLLLHPHPMTAIEDNYINISQKDHSDPLFHCTLSTLNPKTIIFANMMLCKIFAWASLVMTVTKSFLSVEKLSVVFILFWLVSSDSYHPCLTSFL